jgi:flagellar hook-basal body complex protein FliE
MAIQSLGIRAYANALSNFAKAEQANKATQAITPAKLEVNTPFMDTLKTSIAKINTVQTEKNAMIQSFASGETQNVHELMITLQKAGLAVSMTAAVRNKVLEAYRELSRLQF